MIQTSSDIHIMLQSMNLELMLKIAFTDQRMI